MQQASANVSDSFSFRFRQLFWSQRKAIRVQLTRPIHTKTQAGGGEESGTGAGARNHMQHDCKSAQNQLGPLVPCRHHFWKKNILCCAFHILLPVCVLTEVCMQCDQGITGSRQHLSLKRKVTFTWRVRYNLVKIYYLCSPLYCNINQRTLWVALCREDGTSSPQYSIF